ncbi:hypothetical protein [Streptomyces sp. NPDC020817]|uniref:hypothetical protein n=1 Tax=Streptomyces sp. NPDC020817 TaxID=3365095 RepID=UPI0037ACD103
MSRYLEEAARVLKAAEEHITRSPAGGKDKSQVLRSIAEGYANLAAIDKGLLPAEMVADVLRAIAEKAGQA